MHSYPTPQVIWDRCNSCTRHDQRSRRKIQPQRNNPPINNNHIYEYQIALVYVDWLDEEYFIMIFSKNPRV